MIIVILTIIYALIIYFSFTVNVFGFGLLVYDSAEGEPFEAVSETKRKKLNHFFGDVQSFNHFVKLLNNLVIIASTAIALYVAKSISYGNTLLYVVLIILALALTLVLNLTIAQTFSRRVPDRWIRTTLISRLTLVWVLYFILNPLSQAVEYLTERYKREQLSEEQKEDMVERTIESLADSAGLEEPLVEDNEKEMIGNIFELDQTAVKELMVPRTEIVGIPVTADFEQVQKTVIDSGHSRFPVFEENLDKIEGIVYVKDLFGKFPLPEDNFNLLDYVRKPYFVPETKTSSDLLNELKRDRNHIAIVIDEYGGTAGLVTMEDVIEIIVGDIQDEHDAEEAEIVKLDDGSYRVDANLSIEHLAEYVDIEIEDDEFETVGGLIYDLVGSLPHEGQTVSNEYFQFIVEEIDGQRIKTVRVRKLKPDS